MRSPNRTHSTWLSVVLSVIALIPGGWSVCVLPEEGLALQPRALCSEARCVHPVLDSGFNWQQITAGSTCTDVPIVPTAAFGSRLEGFELAGRLASVSGTVVACPELFGLERERTAPADPSPPRTRTSPIQTTILRI